VVDDSIVRGTTSQKLVHMIRQAGAKEVYMRISSPPITHSCLYTYCISSFDSGYIP
jgi:amidophosphoribosyltransferase